MLEKVFAPVKYHKKPPLNPLKINFDVRFYYQKAIKLCLDTFYHLLIFLF